MLACWAVSSLSFGMMGAVGGCPCCAACYLLTPLPSASEGPDPAWTQISLQRFQNHGWNSPAPWTMCPWEAGAAPGFHSSCWRRWAAQSWSWPQAYRNKHKTQQSRFERICIFIRWLKGLASARGSGSVVARSWCRLSSALSGLGSHGLSPAFCGQMSTIE